MYIEPLPTKDLKATLTFTNRPISLQIGSLNNEILLLITPEVDVSYGAVFIVEI